MISLKESIKNVTLFLFDLDGTLYLGSRLFPFTKELLTEIRRQNKNYLFITNNSSKSPADYAIKFREMGIQAEPDEFVTSGRVTSQYLREHYAGKKVYLSGTKSLEHEFSEDGIHVINDPVEAEAVVIGFNTDMSFQTIEDICRIFHTANVPYLGTHPDFTCPNEFGKVPDCGAFAEMLCHATGKMPVFIGKPSPLMPEMAMSIYGARPEETVVIGDRLDTDIESGNAAGTRTILVFSGEAKPKDLIDSTIMPTTAIQDCSVLLETLKEL